MPDEDHIAYAPTPYFVNYIAPTAVKVELAPVEVKPVKVPKKLDRSNFDARAYMLQEDACQLLASDDDREEIPAPVSEA